MKAQYKNYDIIIGRVFFIFSVLVASLLVLIIMFLIKESTPITSSSLDISGFFLDDGWFPLEGLFGVMPMIWASLAIAILAVIFAFPLGVASALFITCYSSRISSRCYRTILNLLAGVPSVIYGLWGLTVLVPLIAHWHPPGASLITASLILAIMILPTIALTATAAIIAIPQKQIISATALALSRKGKLLAVIFPYAKKGIFNGTLLALTRALGETMAVLMVAGNIVQTPSSFFAPVRTLTANIALEMSYATDQHRASLFATGLLLTLIIVFLVLSSHRYTGNQNNV